MKTLLASEGIQTGSVGARADASSFGGGQGMLALGQGLQHLGAGVDNAGDALLRAEEHLKRLDNDRWHNEAFSRISEFSTNFLSDPANAVKDTFHQDYKSKMEDLQKEFVANAPNKEAAAGIDRTIRSITAQGYEKSVGIVVKGKVDKAVSGYNQTINTAAASFGIDPTNPNALADFSQTFNTVQDQIEKNLKPIAQATGSAAQERNAIDAIASVSSYNPAFAKDLLEHSFKKGWVDGTKYSQLNRNIETLLAQRRSELIPAFNDAYKGILDKALEGKFPDQGFLDASFSRKNFEEVLPSGQAQAAYYKFSEQMDALRTVYEGRNGKEGIWPSIRGLNPAEQQAAIERFSSMDQQSGYSHVDQTAVHVLRQLSARNIQEYHSDPTAWLQHNNIVVSQARQALIENPKMGREYLNELILHFQGPEPADVKPELKGMFLNLANPSLLTKSEAKDYATRIENSRSSSEVIQLYGELKSSYTTPEHLYTALADLKEAGLKVPGQLIIQNIDQPFIAAFVDSQTKSAAVEGFDKKTFAEIQTALDTNPTIAKMAAGMGVERIGDMAMAKQSIGAYAALLHAEDPKLSAAAVVKMASERVLESTLMILGNMFVGSGTVIPRKVGATTFDPSNSDNHAAAMEELLTQKFDPEGLDWQQFPADLTDRAKQDRLYEIQRHSRWRITKDGSGLNLMMKDDGGHWFALRNKDQVPIVLDLENDLPGLTDNWVEAKQALQLGTGTGREPWTPVKSVIPLKK